ncbi:MAG: hypothetical protein HY063_07660 [Bacteroidetes bacterium]|nr:hypothetical protein [Bacteroidota bacterium]
MKNIFQAVVIIFLFAPLFSFSQNAADKLKELNTILQDGSKPKSESQSNLAVSDEGASGSKQNSPQKKTENPAKKNSGATGSSGAAGLAVSDEGATGPKGGTKTNKEASGTGTSSGEPKSSETKTVQPK